MKKVAMLLALMLALMTPFAMADEVIKTVHYESEYGFSIDYDTEKWQLLDKNSINALIDAALSLGVIDEAMIEQMTENMKYNDIIYLIMESGNNANVGFMRLPGISGLTTDMLPSLDDYIFGNMFEAQELQINITMKYSALNTYGENMFFEVCSNISIPEMQNIVQTYYMIASGDSIYVIVFISNTDDYEPLEAEVHKILESFKLEYEPIENNIPHNAA